MANSTCFEIKWDFIQIILFYLEFRIALVQLLVGNNKIENVKNAVKSIELAAKNGSSIVALPVIIDGNYIEFF